MSKWIGAMLATLLVSGCVAGGGRSAAAPIPTATTEPEEIAPVLPADEGLEAPSPPQEVGIPGAEGLILRGTWYAPRRDVPPAVLLLHMYGRDRSDWAALAEQLRGGGIGALAIDLRGHGETGGAEDWVLAGDDVRAAYTWLASMPEVDARRIAVLGASIGANLALRLGAEDAKVAAVLLLSPGFDYFRVEISGTIERYGPRPAFLAASEDDGYSADTVRDLAENASGDIQLVILPSAGHGTQMLVSEPDLGAAILEFLLAHIGPGA